MNSYIKAEHLSYVYEDGDAVPALKGISLSIDRGEYVAVVGHNGSGKSTFAKLLNLILVPTAGKLTVSGKEISPDFTDDDVFEIRSQVGMVFQNPDDQIVATVVEEDVAFGPENLGIAPEEIRERVRDALESVGMTAYRKHSPSHLSGGQKQRVALAGVIAMRPSCIIFDESTAMLDPRGRQDILRAMESLNRETGMTVVHITHYMEEAARANRIVVMNDGEILLDGTPREVFRRAELLRSVGLTVPQGTELLLRLAKKGYPVATDALTPSECAAEIFRLFEKGESK